MGNIVWKILGTGAAVLSAMFARKVADKVWTKAGRTPVDPKSPDAPLASAIGYAALTGLAVGAARTLATRKAAQYYANSAGHLPKELQTPQT